MLARGAGRWGSWSVGDTMGVCRRALLCRREARAEKSQGNMGSKKPEGRAPRRPCACETPGELGPWPSQRAVFHLEDLASSAGLGN